MRNIKSTLYIVIPCYNEGEVLPETASQLKRRMEMLMQQKKISTESKILFVNDGSRDRTWKLIERYHKQDGLFAGINLSRNKGHQNALLAGLMTAKKYADITISMDADLQDDLGVIEKMVDKYQNEGCDIVYGVRNNRETDTFFKRFTAETFYKVMNKFGADIVFNHADCRLMSRRALEGLEEFQEVNLFLRGIVPMIGYRSDVVTYKRNERFAGESKYPLTKMVSFALEGITSVSSRPIRMITGVGGIVFLGSILMLIYSLVRFFQGHTVAGWTSVMVSVWGIGGLLILSVGVIGEYIGKIYMETKHRPKFIIEKVLIDSRIAGESRIQKRG